MANFLSLGKGHGGLHKTAKIEERSERLRGEGDKIKFIDLRLERGQVVRFRKVRRQDVS